MKSNMSEDAKLILSQDNPIPNIITPDLVKEAWNYAALKRVIDALGMVLYKSNINT